MTSRFTELSIDCADPDALAAFWCAALDYRLTPEQDEEDGVVTIGPSTGKQGADDGRPGAPRLTFARVPEGKIVKNRVHLDLSPLEASQAEEVERLIGLGAHRAEVGQGDVSWIVMADPEGNEFCVLATPAR